MIIKELTGVEKGKDPIDELLEMLEAQQDIDANPNEYSPRMVSARINAMRYYDLHTLAEHFGVSKSGMVHDLLEAAICTAFDRVFGKKETKEEHEEYTNRAFAYLKETFGKKEE